MKRFLFFILIIAGLQVSAVSAAQDIRYPEEVRAVFEKADAASSAPSTPSTSSGTGLAGSRTFKPVIAVPDCREKEHLAAMARIAGCTPVAIPPMEGLENPYSDLRNLAASWDGALFPDGWVEKDNVYSVLFYKAVADRNIPCIGTSGLTKAIDDGLRRLPGRIVSMEELAVKARTFNRAKTLMDGIFTVDTHCDLPEEYPSGASVGKRSPRQCSIQKMEEGHLDAQVLISFLWQGATDDASSRKAAEKNFRQIAICIA